MTPSSLLALEEAKLTASQLRALRWLSLFPQRKFSWRRNGKAAYGPPETWDAFKIEGTHGSITISAEDWEALRPFRMFTANPDAAHVFIPNEAGHRALKEAGE